ncbi:MAG: thiosulfate/3-mercaptopyruvate sulfurtransferase [Bacteroidetes bacterium]|nr:MAG: thiosulfate/3-mercaptopyruvate sulfurtransferase [Bacteroidota bacterium]
MKRLNITLGLILAFVLGSFAQDLISVADLAKELKNPDYIVVSGEIETEYAKVHITGAVNVSYKAFFKPGDIEGLLVSNEEIAKILGDNGVSEKKTIIVYDEGSMKYSGRLYFILKYMGAAKVKVLDGGLEAWKAGRKPVTKNPSNIAKTTFVPKVNAGLLVSMSDVKGAKGKADVVLVDSREVGEFKGLENKSTGHIPGSINWDHTTLIDAKHMLKPKAEIEKMLAEKGITKDKNIILYCSTGVRASKEYLVLTSVLGYTKVKIYDNGYNEWKAAGNEIVK